jgi:hypothetical protein
MGQEIGRGFEPVVPAINQEILRLMAVPGPLHRFIDPQLICRRCLVLSDSARLLKRLAQAHGIEASQKFLRLGGESALRVVF